jgi:hypothetical protein
MCFTSEARNDCARTAAHSQNPSGCLLRLRREFDDFSALLRGNPLFTLAKRARNVELDYLGHSPASSINATSDRRLTPQRPCHSQPQSQRTESHKRSFRSIALHTAHDLIHINTSTQIKFSECMNGWSQRDGFGLLADCQMIVANRYSGATCCSFAYSAFACFRMGMPGSASFHRPKKS